MRSLVFTICLVLCLAGCCRADSLKKKFTFSGDYKIGFDEHSLDDNSLVYSACRVDQIRNDMNCDIALQSFPDSKGIKQHSCQMYYKADKGHRIDDGKFRLRKLFETHVAFVWAEQEHLQSDSPRRRLLLSIVDMHDCKSHDYPFEAAIDDFHMVVYERTFDVYYHNRSMSRQFVSGMTFDSTGELINGPAVSFLPSEYFTGSSRICSVKADSSELGHYVITPSDFYLVSAEYDKKIQMGAIPFDNRNAVYDCSKEYLGYCWQLNNNRRIVNCEQFNRDGKDILSTGESLPYEPGTWMAMKNIGPADLLIVVNECSNAEACAADTAKVKFHVLKVNYKGKAVELHRFEGLECNNATFVDSEVTQKDDGRICATVACKTGAEGAEQSISFLSTCFLQ